MAMARALARHDELTATAIGGWGGRVFKHTGDGVCAVFGGAVAALAAALELQQQLGAEDWSAVDGLAVRMGVHTGDAEVRGDDYFGPALNRCARIMAAAHGGQVLVSAATAALVVTALPEGVELLDLGDHSLRDLEGRERLWQATAPGLRRSFPSLRTPGGFEHNLPASRSSFIGREVLVHDVIATLSDHRLVTLTAIGGAGKTRMALEVAGRLIDRFPDGVFWVDLSAVFDGGVIASEIARVLRLERGGGSSASSSLLDDVCRVLGPRTALFVIDNCEQVIDDCADVVDALLGAGDGVSVIATSREPLSVEGEAVLRVPPLTVPEGSDAVASEAGALFVERATAVNASFDPVAAAGAVGEICRRLDGIPLAIELAAAQVPYLAPADIAARLDDRFRLLTGGRRRVPRQQTLEAAIDWSHDLLSSDEQVLFRRLGVFVGGVALADADDVAGGEPLPGDLFALTRSLVAKSLLSAVDDVSGTRFRMLESVRLYAIERLAAAGEIDELRGRHRDHYLALVEAAPLLDRYGGFELLAHQERNIDNLRAALDWSQAEGNDGAVARLAAALVPLWWVGGLSEEGLLWLGRALEAEVDPDLRVDLLVADAVARQMQGEDWVPLLDRIASIDGTGRALVSQLNRDCWHAFWAQAGDPAMARLLVERAEVQSAPHPEWLGFVYLSWACIELWDGSLEEADRRFQMCEDACVAVAPRAAFLLFMARAWRSITLHLIGRDDKALEVLRPVDGAEAGWGAYVYDLARGFACAGLGRADEARQALACAARHVRRRAVPLAPNDLLLGFAAVAWAEGDPERASVLLHAAVCGPQGAAFRVPITYRAHSTYAERLRAALSRERRAELRAEAERSDREALLDGEVAADGPAAAGRGGIG